MKIFKSRNVPGSDATRLTQGKSNHHRRLSGGLTVLLIVAVLMLVRPFLSSLTNASAKSREIEVQSLVQNAWERARAAGSYSFTSDVVEITIPTVKVTNVGRPSRTEQLHLEGQSDLDAAAIEFRLWSEGGNVHSPETGLAVRAANGKSYTRQGTGAWQESSSFSDAIAPDGDFMGYLAAARDITRHAPETRAGISFTRYSFQIDGPTFAAYYRNQLEAAMLARGELPNGVHFEVSSYYRNMTGDGELWVRKDGLPLRQVLNIRFPEQNDESVQAQIKVDFSHFGQMRFVGGEFVQVDPASTGGSFAGVADTLQRNAPDFGYLLTLFAMILGLAILVVYYRRARTLQVAFALAMITSMVVGPLLNTLKLATFFGAQTARAAEQSARYEESQMMLDLRAQDAAPQFNPLQSLLAAESAAPALAPAMAASASPANAALLQTTPVLTFETGLDTDDDGLTDFVEQRIGTNTTIWDTDGDRISDKMEVGGFTTTIDNQTRTWYTDPLNYDTNDDGLADTEEWGDLEANPPAPSDADGDGIPDLFEEDNDNDGVPDRLDLAPFSKISSFSDLNPFKLTINNMAVGKPIFVDLQLRPQDANNLWFAGNVLDWPQDNQGQVQDVDGFTYADYAAANYLAVEQNDSFGDLKLTPMLEIRVPSDSANLPSKEILQAYQVLYNDLDTNSAEKLLYLPLTVVSDQRTGARVAFAARMRYERANAQELWTNAHQMRLVWTVQMLQDVPCDPDDNSTVSPPCVDGYRHNVPQVIHSYKDDWTLTGVNVREEHGTKIALAYEDPAVDGDPKDENALMNLAVALQGSFLEGRDCDNPDTVAKVCSGDGQRDLKIEDLYERFDHTSTNRPATTDPERLGFTGALDILTVETPIAYESLDWALTQTVTKSQTVLNQFVPQWQSDNQVKPLVMYAYETKFRSLGLDAKRGLTANANLYVALSGSQLAFDLQPSGLDTTPIQTVAGMKWTPYCAATGTTPTWEICDGVAYWQTLESRYGADIATVFPDAVDTDVARGRLAMLQLFWLTLAQGVQQAVANQLVDFSSPEELVYSPEELVNLNSSYDVSDNEVDGLIKTGTTIGKFGAMLVANRMALKSFEYVDPKGIQYVTLLKNVGSTFNGKESFGTISRLRHLGSGNGMLVTGFVLVAGLVATSVLLQQYGNASQQQAGNILLQSIFISATTVGSIIMPIAATVSATRAATTTGAKLAAASNALTSRTEVVGISRSAIGIGALIGVGLTWGFFGMQIASGEIKPGTIAFNVAVATTIGTTIYILLLAALSVTPVGLIVVGLLTLIDQFATLFCDTGVVDRQKDGSCFTIGGAFAEAVGKEIYKFGTVVNIKDPDIIVAGVPDFTLTNIDKGFVVGSTASITLPVTTTVKHKNPQSVAIDYHNFYISEGYLKSTTFSRTLSANETPLTVDVGQMSDQWTISNNGKWDGEQLYKIVQTADTAATVAFNEAGLNRFPPLYLNTGYALPAYECWGLGAMNKCEKKTIKGSNSSPFLPLGFDIFPATVSAFAATKPAGDGGNAFNWDPAFPTLWDADGDGLISPAYNGNDPNDGKWDTDSDGLSDAFELELRMSGVNVTAILADADNDGLTDRKELQLRTNPANDDTDNDGLSDGAEAAGWLITVPGINHQVRVFPDPTRADSDGDGLSDLAERQLAASGTPKDAENRPYHPNVFNSSPIKVYTVIDGTDGPWYVKPGQFFDYQTTVVATVPLAPGVIDFNVPAEFGSALTPRRLEFDPQTFTGTQAIDWSNILVPDASLNTQTTELFSVVRTRLAPTGPSNLQWDAFNTAQVNTLSDQRFLTADPFDVRRADRYLFGTLTSTLGVSGGDGVIEAKVYPENWTQTTDTSIARRPVNDASPDYEDHDFTKPALPPDYQSAALRGASSHDIACNDAGQCLGVWEKEYCTTIQLDSIRVELKGAENNGIEPLVYFIADRNDTNPTNGGYELIWDARENGGSDMPASKTANTTGFPKSIEVCGPGRIDIYETDTSNYSYADTANGAGTTWGNMDLMNGIYVDRDGIDCTTSLNLSTDVCPTGSGRDFDEIVKFAQTDGTPDVRLDISFRSRSSYYAIQGGILNYNTDETDLVSQPLSIISYNPYGGNNFAPVVASDGNGYLVAHEQVVNGITYILLIHYSSDFLTYNVNRYEIENPRLAGKDIRSVVMDLVWSGDRYTLAYKFIRDSGATPMYFATFNPDGTARTTFRLLDSGPGTAGTPEQPVRNINGQPVLAYDPFANNTLLIFADTSSLVRWTKITGDTSFSRPDFLKPDGTNAFGTGGFAPGLAYNPMVNGWLITNAIRQAVLMNSSLSAQLLVPVTFATGSGRHDLACPAPISQPAVDLRFEDLPGVGSSTNGLFVDSSIFGRNATCTTGGVCPTSGLPGAKNPSNNPVGKPASDYAVTFDGIDDQIAFANPASDGLTLAFWYKANQGAGGLGIALGSNNTLSFSTNGNTFNFKGLSGSVTLADGKWHHVVATRASGSGALTVYVDKIAVVSAASSPAWTPAANGTISSTSGNQVSLDELKLYRTALDAFGVKQLYNNGELPAYCVSMQQFGLSANASRLNVSSPDTRGGFITAQGGLTVTVDADAPTAQITKPAADNTYYKGSQGAPTVITIGGTASDPTSFISKIEVDSGSGWALASGLEEWLAQVSVTEGVYTLNARATDTVGNLGPANTRSFIADATPPTIAITLSAGTLIAPNGNAETGWTVSLSGPTSDPAIGSNPGSGVASVEVTLQSQETGQEYEVQLATVQAGGWNISYPLPTYLTDPSGSYTVTVTAEDAVGNRSASVVTTLSLDINGPEVELSQLDQARLLISDTLTISGIISDTGVAGVAGLEINFQSVEEVAVISADTAVSQALSQVSWTPISLDTSGAGVASSTWSFAIPAGMESEYQMNLRSTDTQGNVRLHPNVWRGIIDTTAPRVSIVVTATGASYFDEPSDSDRYEFEYQCLAEDRYLSEPTFACPGDAIQEPVRSFNIDPLVQAIFPDRTILYQLENTYAAWEDSQQPLATLQACDIFGHCATDSTGVTSTQPLAAAAFRSPGAPQAVIVAPLQGRYVAASGSFPVTIAAEAGEALQQVTLSLDGSVIQTLTFAQADNITSLQRTIPISVTGEVEHTLVAQATDWASNVQQTLYPVTFTLDTLDPVVTLDTDLLGVAETWGLGSDVLRFNGTARDSMGLAAVQIKIGDAPFVDVTFDGNAWYTAQQVPDPEGKTLTVRVRAIDRAGRITEVTGNIGVDLTTTNSPETVITSQAPDSNSTSAEISFSGTDGSGNEVSAFDCRLDNGVFVACGSPKSFTDLSNGLHRVEVRAIDDEGFVDSSPAIMEWTVQVTDLATTIDQQPTDPTFSREASFAFSGSAGVTSFECALDGSPFSTCSSPHQYTGLRDGNHTFLVRGLDGAGNKGAATRYTWRVENQLPIADDQSVLTFGATSVDITLTASDTDELTYHLIDLPANGLVQFTAPNVVRYSPDSGFGGVDTFTFKATDGQLYSDPATVTVLVNYEPVITVDPAAQAVQYSDGIAPVTVTVDDLDSSGNALVIVSATWSDGVNSYPGLPAQLTLTRVSDNADTVPGQVVLTLAGAVDLPVGTYIITLIADDGVGGSITGEPMEIWIEAAPEDVMVRFHGGNPRAVQVANAGDANSGSFELRVDVKELYPDNGALPLPGEIGWADVSMQLVPIGPGGPVDPTGCTTELHDVDYDARLTFVCGFDAVPINTYAVAATVDGNYYNGFDEDVVTIYDPSRGFTTGGGTFFWPGSDEFDKGYAGDETTFGFTIEYNKKGKKLQGQLSVIRRLPDGTVHRIKTNVLDGLSVGAETGFSWASFSGKVTYQSPQMEVAEGNHTFIAYMEDHGDTGDRFWLQVKDKDGNVILALSLDEPAANNATLIGGGNIVVP